MLTVTFTFPKSLLLYLWEALRLLNLVIALYIDCSAIVLQAAGRKVALVKSSLDNRYHSARIVTHNGHSKVCLMQCLRIIWQGAVLMKHWSGTVPMIGR